MSLLVFYPEGEDTEALGADSTGVTSRSCVGAWTARRCSGHSSPCPHHQPPPSPRPLLDLPAPSPCQPPVVPRGPWPCWPRSCAVPVMLSFCPAGSARLLAPAAVPAVDGPRRLHSARRVLVFGSRSSVVSARGASARVGSRQRAWEDGSSVAVSRAQQRGPCAWEGAEAAPLLRLGGRRDPADPLGPGTLCRAECTPLASCVWRELGELPKACTRQTRCVPELSSCPGASSASPRQPIPVCRRRSAVLHTEV